MKIPTPQDEQLRLEPLATAAASYITATFDLGAFFQTDNGRSFGCVINVPAIAIGGDKTYFHKLQESPDGTTWTDASANLPITGPTTAMVVGFVSNRYVRRVITIAGTAPSITNESWLNPNAGLIR
jgi:hypothetical protein